MRLKWLLIIMCLAISQIPIGIIIGLQGFQIENTFLWMILALILFTGYLISYYVSKPLVTLTKKIDEISKGNLDVELEKSEIYEINNLTASLDRVMASLKLAIHKVGLKKEDIFEEVTKIKQEAELKYENILKKIDGWIWEIDEKATCTVCSSKVVAALGYTAEEIIGKDIYGFLSAEEAQKLKEILAKLPLKHQESADKIDLYWLSKNDSHPVPVRSYVIPAYDHMGRFIGVRGFSRDISEYQGAQNKIMELTTKIQSMNKKMHELIEEQLKPNPIQELHGETASEQEFDYMFIFDENTKIVDCTNDIQRKLGYNKEEMLTLSLTDIAFLESKEEMKASYDVIKTQGMLQMKTIHKKKDGSSVFVSELIKFLKDRNMYICMVKEDSI